MADLGQLDIVFVIDSTGSMGSYLDSVKKNVVEIIQKISSLEVCKSVQMGLISYHDHCDSGKNEELHEICRSSKEIIIILMKSFAIGAIVRDIQ